MKKILLSILSIFFCLGMLTGGAIMLSGCNSSSYSENNPLEENPGGGNGDNENLNDDSQNENDENLDDGIDDYAVNVRRATLIFNANGGSGAPSSMSGTAPNTGDIGGNWSVKFTIPTTVPTRSGYDFVKWSRNSDGSGASYSPGGTIYVGGSTSELIASTTLYAIWEEEVTPYSTFRYNITINGSGGGSVSVWSDYDAATTLIASGSGSVEGRYCAVQASANSGYKASVTGVRYYYFNSSGSITYSSSVPSSTNGGRSGSFSFSVTFTRLSYTLSYNGNGSTGGSTSSHSGVTLTVKSCGFTKTGYSFTYWTTSSSGGTRYDPGDSITLIKNTTLYAQWEKDIVYYTVSYSSGSSSASGSVSSQQVESGGSVVVKNNGFSRTGYSFAYWTWNGNIYYPGNTMSNITSNRTLTASWSRSSYTNRYYYRNTNGRQDYDDQTRYYGSTFYMFDTSDISEYVSNGWSLAGWTTSSSSTSVSYSPGQSRSSTSTSMLSYYAISSRTVSLNYNSNGGSSISSRTSTQKWHQYNNYYDNPDFTVSSTEPTRTGYNFLGWSTSSSATTVNYDPGDTYTFSNGYSSSSSVTLYAVWEAKIIPVSLNWNDGDGGTSMIYLKYDSGWYSNSTATSSITSITAPTRTGFTFNGYNTALNGTGTTLINSSGTITASDTYYSTDGTKTIYAQWKANNPAYYDSAGGYWYVENGKMPQTRVTDSGTISGINSSSTTGTTYYFAGLSLQSKVYNGKEYCQYNNSWYEVMPIKWRLVYASSQTTGYGTETDTLAVMAEIVYADAFSDSFLGANAGYSSESVTELKKNQIDGTYLVTETKSMLTFGSTTINGTPTSVSSNIFIVARDDLSSFTTSANGAEKAGSVKFSDLVEDYLLANGKGTLYYTRDLGTNYNNIFCMNANGDRVQYKAQNYFGVQFTIKISEYACV